MGFVGGYSRGRRHGAVLLVPAAMLLVFAGTGAARQDQQRNRSTSEHMGTTVNGSAGVLSEVEPARGARHPGDSAVGVAASTGRAPSRTPGQAGSYALREVRNVQVRSHDGVMLDGWIASPAVLPGVRTPTVLVVSPYFDMAFAGQATVIRNPSTPPDPDCPVTGQGCGFWSDGPMSADTRVHSLGFPPIHLINQGYTLAYFSVRGTGSSGGCFEWGGRSEQLDQAALVDWLADQSWSNGRVGMGGLSYLAYTAWQAAVQAPPALKAIVTAGDLVDFYQVLHSPQGSRGPGVNALLIDYDTELGLEGGAISGRTQFLQHEGCPHVGLAAQEAVAVATGDRNAPYWRERNLSLRLPDVRAAVLDTTGYLDVGHQFQADTIWGSLDRRTPKVQYKGWWMHEFPTPDTFDLPSGTVEWESVVVRWLDYWLKDIGPEPRTERVYHQDQELRWHESASWSPEPSGKQVLYLTGEELTPIAQQGSTSFRSAPPPDASWAEHSQLSPVDDPGGVESSLCQDALSAQVARVYQTPPVSSRTLLAGNPFAYLRLSSDQAGGIVTASLFDIGPDFTCTGAHYEGARWLSSGSADLNFYDSPFLSREFPVDSPTQVRIDLSDVTGTLAPGHRLALVLSHGSVAERGGTTHFPTITVLGGGIDASQLVVPVASGTLGGKRPTLHYPPRPFTPRHYKD